MVHPKVEAAPVEHVATVGEATDLVAAVKLVKADGAALRRRVDEIRELDDGQELADQDGRNGVGFRNGFGSGRPGDIRVEEVGEAEEAYEGGDEDSDEDEDGEGLEEEFGKEELRVPDWEAHFKRERVGCGVSGSVSYFSFCAI